MRLSRLAMAAAAAAALMLAAPAARATGGGGNLAAPGGGHIRCDPAAGRCWLSAGTPGQAGSPGSPGGPAATGSGAGGGAVDCTFTPVSFSAPASDTADQHPARTGHWYQAVCGRVPIFPRCGAVCAAAYLVWVAGAAVGPPDPAVLARQAEAELALPAPRIDASPAVTAEQLVTLPTWLWLAGGSWAPQSATVTVPGESVTATATPRLAIWTFGDGSRPRACYGPGIPYRAGGSPAAASPDCGHTFTRSSAAQPGGRYLVTVTVSWTVTWAGGGESGILAGLATTATAAMQVAESQAIVTGS